MSLNMFCEECGKDFRRAMIVALTIEFGGRTQDPNWCPATKDHEHVWKEREKPAAAGGLLGKKEQEL